MRLPAAGHAGRATRGARTRGAAGFAVALWLLVILATVALAAQLPPATRTGWTVLIINNYSPCNGPVAAGNCHGSAVITTSGAAATAPLESVTLGGSPYGVVITPDGSLALVVDITDGTLSPIDLTALPPRSLPAVHLGGRGDAFIAMTPDGHTALIADTASPTVHLIHVAGRTIRAGRSIDIGSPAGGIAMSPDGSTAWVVIPTKGTIRPIDVGDGSFAVGTPKSVGALPTTITLSPNGNTAYVSSTARNIVTAVPLGGGPNQILGVGKAPAFTAVSPDGSTMYVANAGSGTVTPVDLSGGAPIARTPFAVPHGVSDAVAVPTAVAITPDGKQLWVTDGGSTVGGPSLSGNTATAYDIRSPLHPLATRTIATGGFEVRGVAITPAIPDTGSGPSTLALSLPTLGDVFLSAQAVLLGVAIAAGGVMFITFPAQIFNLTLQENYPIIATWIARRQRKMRALRSRFGVAADRNARPPAEVAGPESARSGTWRSELPAFVTVIAVGALLGALLDPRFGPNWRGVASYIAIACAIPAVAAITAVLQRLSFRAEHRRPRVHLRALPLGLAVAAICVVISRLVDFQPGYLYGVVCGIAFEGVLATRSAGRLTMATSLAVLAVSIAAWLIWKPVADAAGRPGAFFGLIVLDDFLASLTVGGIVGTAIGLLPLQFLPGAVIRAWKLGAWAVTFGVAMVLLIGIVVRSPLAPVSHSALWVIVALFVVFAALSIGFREYFARRWRRDHGIVVRGLRNRARDLLVPRPVTAAPDAPVDPAALHP